MLDTVVYFSSVTNNTHRFVEKLGLDSVRIPIKGDIPIVDVPFVLVCPTYGGGVTMDGSVVRPVPPQVRKFLSDETNVENMKAVISAGNTNFGTEYGKAGKVISKRFNVPYVYAFELMGSTEDVEIVKHGLANFSVEEK